MLARVLLLIGSVSMLILSAATHVFAGDLVSGRGSDVTEFCNSFDADRQTSTKI